MSPSCLNCSLFYCWCWYVVPLWLTAPCLALPWPGQLRAMGRCPCCQFLRSHLLRTRRRSKWHEGAARLQHMARCTNEEGMKAAASDPLKLLLRGRGKITGMLSPWCLLLYDDDDDDLLHSSNPMRVRHCDGRRALGNLSGSLGLHFAKGVAVTLPCSTKSFSTPFGSAICPHFVHLLAHAHAKMTTRRMRILFPSLLPTRG